MAAQTWQQQLGITQWPDFRTVKLFGALRARRLYLENYVQAALAGLPTYYFSNSSGNDSNPGTSSSPMQTMAKCNDILSTQAAICYFKAGDEWNETNGIVIPKGGSLQAYGSGLKPFFNYFTVKIPSTSWTLVSGTTYSATVSQTLGHLRISGREGNAAHGAAFIVGQPTATNNLFAFAYYNTLSLLEAANVPCWMQSGTTVYVNIAGTGLTSIPNMEGTIANSAIEAGSGVLVQSDAVLVRGIRADGWGTPAASSGWGVTQSMPFLTIASGTMVTMWENVEAYFSASPVMAMEAAANSNSAGGINLLKNYKMGWPSAVSGGEATHVDFAPDGGQECYHYGGECITGSVPWIGANGVGGSGSYGGFASQNAGSRGQGWIAHTTTGTPSTCWYINCRSRLDGQNWVATGPQPQLAIPSTPTEATGFNIGYRTVGKVPQSWYANTFDGSNIFAHALAFTNTGVVNIGCVQDDVIGSGNSAVNYYSGNSSCYCFKCRLRLRVVGPTTIADLIGDTTQNQALNFWDSSLVIEGASLPATFDFALFSYPKTNSQMLQNSLIQLVGALYPLQINNNGTTYNWLGNVYYPTQTGDTNGVSIPTPIDIDCTPDVMSILASNAKPYADGIQPEYDINLYQTTGLYVGPFAEYADDIAQPSDTVVLAPIAYGSPVAQSVGTLTLPANTQVENGVEYGEGGNSLVGNVVLPNVTNVASGVEYGPNGTSLVGTLGAPPQGGNYCLVSDSYYNPDGSPYVGPVTVEILSLAANWPAGNNMGASMELATNSSGQLMDGTQPFVPLPYGASVQFSWGSITSPPWTVPSTPTATPPSFVGN